MVVTASSKGFGLFHFIPGEDGKDVIPHSLGIHSSATTENDPLSMMWVGKENISLPPSPNN